MHGEFGKRRKLKTDSGKTEVSPMAGLISCLLAAAPTLHYVHLQTRNHAAHVALDEFYKELPSLVDNVAEQYQGVTLEILEYPKEIVEPIGESEVIPYLQKLHKKISMYQENCMHSEIINELDVIKSFINSTVYKLNFLE